MRREQHICNQFNGYLDGELSADAAVHFEQHLKTCAACGDGIRMWQKTACEMKADAMQWAQRTAAQVCMERQQLMASFEQHRALPFWYHPAWRVALVAMAASGVLFMAGHWFFSSMDKSAANVSRAKTVNVTHYRQDGSIRTSTQRPDAVLSAGTNESLQTDVDDDRVAVGPGAEIKLNDRVKRTPRVVLSHGWVACRVSKRKADDVFVTRTSDDRFSIEVKGTRFGVQYPKRDGSVAKSDAPHLLVAVTEGLVLVTGNSGGQWMVSAQNQLVVLPDGTAMVTSLSRMNRKIVTQLLSPSPFATADLGIKPQDAISAGSSTDGETAKKSASDKTIGALRPWLQRNARRSDTAETPSPKVDEIKRWIVSGQHVDAIAALEQRLKSEPQNGELWRLLAESRRKTGSYREAVDAYQHVIRLASAPVANAARYKTGLIYQNRLGRPLDAARHFSDYLASPEPQLLRAEALLHLGRARISLGDTSAARAHLTEVIREHAATAAAMEARKLLQNLPE
ncbi:MAG: tetratricopeptide repeat protein [Deltaproteobacteria bacterium]|nr:tetratricopeptide repeat protein [Deltaproteobacteria bacterium]